MVIRKEPERENDPERESEAERESQPELAIELLEPVPVRGVGACIESSYRVWIEGNSEESADIPELLETISRKSIPALMSMYFCSECFQIIPELGHNLFDSMGSLA